MGEIEWGRDWVESGVCGEGRGGGWGRKRGDVWEGGGGATGVSLSLSLSFSLTLSFFLSLNFLPAKKIWHYSHPGSQANSNPATRNRTRDHLIAASIYSQMLYQLSYSRLAIEAVVFLEAVTTEIIVKERERERKRERERERDKLPSSKEDPAVTRSVLLRDSTRSLVH